MGTLINQYGELFSFDAKTTEEYDESAEVTDNPVEGGAVVTDHRLQKPMTISVEGIISETPLDNAVSGVRSEPTEVEPGAIIFDITDLNAPYIRGWDAWTYLQRSRTGLCTWVSTRLGTIENLLIKTVKTSVPGSQSLRFSIGLKQVVFAQSTLVAVPREYRPKPASQPLQQCTDQAPKDITGPVNDAKAASILANSDDTFFGGMITRSLQDVSDLSISSLLR